MKFKPGTILMSQESLESMTNCTPQSMVEIASIRKTKNGKQAKGKAAKASSDTEVLKQPLLNKQACREMLKL